MSKSRRFDPEIILNIVIIILTVTGVAFMLTGKPEEGALQATGFGNFKFYTVLTNVFYGFLNWGWPVGIMIFTGITLSAFAAACLFRAISNKRSLDG